MSRWLALLGTLLLASPVATAEVATPSEYRQALAEAAVLVEQARQASGAEQARLADAARARLEQIERVRLDDGSEISPSNERLLDALAEQPPDLEAAAHDLAALRQALERSEEAGHLDAAEARARLEAVLARPEFQPRPRQPSFLEPILGPVLGIARALQDFVLQQLERIYQVLLDVLAGRVSAATVLVALLAVAAVLGAALFVATRLAAVMAPETRAERRQAAAQRRSVGASWARALERAEAGDYRAAVRLLYLATLLALDEVGRLRYQPTLTNREHLRQAPLELRPVLEPLVERYDRLWYGQLPCQRGDYLQFLALAQRAREAAE